MAIILITLFITLLLLFLSIGFIWLISKLTIKKIVGKNVRYRYFGYATLLIGGLWTLMLFYGYTWGRWRYEVTNWTFTDAKLPASFENYRIVHISDLHLEGFDDNPAHLDTLVHRINELDADLICFTGDLVSFSHKGLIPYLNTLQQLKSNDGVISILGNHDYAVYDRALDSVAKELDRKALISLEKEQLNWHLLLNEHTILHRGNDSIAIVGSENQACGPHQKVRKGNLLEAISGTEGIFKILLTHDPSHWDVEVLDKTDIPLTLSGHTHAMQFRILEWTPCRLFYKRSDGAYRVGQQQIYVNIGLGQLMPFRIGAMPEITLITLKRSK